MSSTELEPDPAEIQGDEPSYANIPPVPVSIRGPVETRIMGSRVGVSRSITVTTTPETVLGADVRRRRAVFLAAAAVRLGTLEDVNNDAGFLLSANVPLEITHVDIVWCRSDTSTARLSILVEEWTE